MWLFNAKLIWQNEHFFQWSEALLLFVLAYTSAQYVRFKSKLPETARAEPDRGRGVRSVFVRHTLRAPEMFEQEVEIILRGLEGQLVQ